MYTSTINLNIHLNISKYAFLMNLQQRRPNQKFGFQLRNFNCFSQLKGCSQINRTESSKRHQGSNAERHSGMTESVQIVFDCLAWKYIADFANITCLEFVEESEDSETSEGLCIAKSAMASAKIQNLKFRWTDSCFKCFGAYTVNCNGV